MTDTISDAPAAGWYHDPGADAAYRWWDGARWTTATLADKPVQTAGSAPGTRPHSPAPSASTDALPTRRTARAETDEAPHPADKPRPSIAGPVGPFAAGRAAQQQPQPEPPRRQPHRQSYPQQQPQAPYRPVNPLTRPGAPAVSVGPSGFSVPGAWAANAPAVAPAPAYGGLGRFADSPQLMPVDKAINRPARNGMALGILSMLQVTILIGVVADTGRLFVVWAVWGLGGLIWSIVGLVKARRWEAQGFVPLGVRRAIAGIILCSVALLAQGTESALALASTVQPATGGSHLSPGTAARTVAPALEPDVAVLQGAGTYVYSKAQAQGSIAAAYRATLKSTPTGVVCPTTEPLQVSVTFPCTVTIQGGVVTTAQVTIIDEQGHVEVQVH